MQVRGLYTVSFISATQKNSMTIKKAVKMLDAFIKYKKKGFEGYLNQ